MSESTESVRDDFDDLLEDLDPWADEKGQQDEDQDDASEAGDVAHGADSNPDQTQSAEATAAPSKQGERAPEAAEAAQTPSTTPSTTPFTFKADGRKVTVEGASLSTDGKSVSIPLDAWQRIVQPHLADRSAWQREREQYQRQLKAADVDTNPTVVQAKAFMDKVNALLDAGPEAAAEWLDNLAANRELLVKDAELAALKSEREQMQALRAQQEQEEQEAYFEAREEEVRPQLQNWLTGTVQEFVSKRPELAGLDHAALATQLWDDLAEAGELFALATERVQLEDGTILNPGDVHVDFDRLYAELDRAGRFYTAAASSAQARAKAQAVNASVMGAPSTPPPTVTARGAATGATRRPAAPKTREEWLASLDFDDDEE